MQVEPYLYFDGRAEEAINFYKSVLSAKLNMLVRFKDSPVPHGAGTEFDPDKIMHASLTIGNSTLLLSDGHCTGRPNFAGFSLSITAPTDAEAQRLFPALAAGGTITQPLSKTFFSTQFGMLTDQFGVGWMVMVGE